MPDEFSWPSYDYVVWPRDCCRRLSCSCNWSFHLFWLAIIFLSSSDVVSALLYDVIIVNVHTLTRSRHDVTSDSNTRNAVYLDHYCLVTALLNFSIARISALYKCSKTSVVVIVSRSWCCGKAPCMPTFDYLYASVRKIRYRMISACVIMR